MKQKNSKNNKGRNWAFVVYPESLPENWLEILKFSGLKIAISPLHDADFNADETEKKPHYHIIAIWEGPTTYDNVLNFTKKFKGTIPIKLEQVRGYYRYFTHEDNPEKAQYDKSEIKHINGFNIADFVELTKSEITKMKLEIMEIITSKDLTEYATLMEFLREIDRIELWEIASNNTLFFNSFIKSRRHRQQQL